MKKGRCFLCHKCGHKANDPMIHPKEDRKTSTGKQSVRCEASDEEDTSKTVNVRICKNVGKTKELRIQATIVSFLNPGKKIDTTAVIDTGAGATFVNWMFIRKYGIKTHELEKPFSIRTADGKTSEKKCARYCQLAIKIDDRLMIGKFNVMNMSDRDMILLGKPWLTAMNPEINWTNDTLRLPATDRSS